MRRHNILDCFILCFTFVIALSLSCLLGTESYANDIASANDVIVVFKMAIDEGADIEHELQKASNKIATAAGAYVVKIYTGLTESTGQGFALLRSSALSPEMLIKTLERMPEIISATLNETYSINDGTNNNRAGSNTRTWNLDAIGAIDVWDKYTQGGDNVYVAVLDTGLSRHNDLNDNVDWTLARDFTGSGGIGDINGHGTHVAGIVASVGGSSRDTSGTATNLKIIPIKTTNAAGNVDSDAMLSGLQYLIGLLRSPDPIKLAAINMSWGGYQFGSPYDYMTKNPIGIALKTISDLPNSPLIVAGAANCGFEVGCQLPLIPPIVTCTAGHIHSSLSSILPASISHLEAMKSMVSVASIGHEGDIYYAGASTCWSDKCVELAAPGVDIYSARSDDQTGYIRKSGTSMAAPHVAGAAALVAAYLDEKGFSWNGALLKELLIKTASLDINPENLWAKENRPKDKASSYKISKHGLVQVNEAIKATDSLPRATKISYIDRVYGEVHINYALISKHDEAIYKVVLTPERAMIEPIEWSVDTDTVLLVDVPGNSNMIKVKLNPDIEYGRYEKIEFNLTAKIANSNITASKNLTANNKCFNTAINHDEWVCTNTDRIRSPLLHWHTCLTSSGKKGDCMSGIELHNADWSYDESRHWKDCTICGATGIDRMEHRSSSRSQPIPDGELINQYAFNGRTMGYEYDTEYHWSICIRCGATYSKTNHVMEDYYNYDKTYHWNECRRCTYKENKTLHMPDMSRTINHGDTHTIACSVCNYRASRVPHEWGNDWDADDNIHWKQCAAGGCGARDNSTAGTHIDNDANNDCDVCHMIINIPTGQDHLHNYHPNDWSTNNDYHWQTCSICKEIVNYQNHGSDSDDWRSDNSDHWHKCAACNMELLKAPHDMKSEWSFDASDHWHECNVCRHANNKQHHVDNNNDRRCDVCGHPYISQNVPSPGTGQSTQKYHVSEGSNSIWDRINALIFKSSAPIEKFLRVEIDDKKVESNYLRVYSGSTVVEVSQEYLNTLDEGIHTIAIISIDGYAKTEFSILAKSTPPDVTPPSSQNANGGSGGCHAGAVSITICMFVVALLMRAKAKR